MRVLIAEDNQEERESLTALAVSFGHEVVAFRDGLEALEALELFDADLLIVDLEMPRMGGMELALHLQARHPHSKWTLVAYSGRSTLWHAAVLTSGFTHCFQKPYDLPAIIAMLGKSV
ncbi:response regulator [Cupriavidus sp. RAF12]|uniref:response regulator n=1 Tax=Cupriavidus sp. RAF12 TaxID=3233050 RepID=UPI003F8FBEE7